MTKFVEARFSLGGIKFVDPETGEDLMLGLKVEDLSEKQLRSLSLAAYQTSVLDSAG